MIHENGQNGYNGNGHSNGSHVLDCVSDYPEMPAAIDVTPKRTPRWQDQVAKYTHNLSWVDADSCQHSMTIRADSLQELLEDLKMIKKGIQIAKAKAKVGKEVIAPDSDVPSCPVHGEPMIRKQSKRTKGFYFSHLQSDGQICFGRKSK